MLTRVDWDKLEDTGTPYACRHAGLQVPQFAAWILGGKAWVVWLAIQEKLAMEGEDSDLTLSLAV